MKTIILSCLILIALSLAGCAAKPTAEMTITEYYIEVMDAPMVDQEMFLGPEISIDYELFEI